MIGVAFTLASKSQFLLLTAWQSFTDLTPFSSFAAGGVFAFPHSSAGCEFPPEWDGIWFQSTVRPYIAIAGAEMSGKGRCVERDRAGEKYILRA